MLTLFHMHESVILIETATRVILQSFLWYKL